MAKKSIRKVVVDSPLKSDDDNAVKEVQNESSDIVNAIAKKLDVSPEIVAGYGAIISKVKRGLYTHELAEKFIKERMSS